MPYAKWFHCALRMRRFPSSQLPHHHYPHPSSPLVDQQYMSASTPPLPPSPHFSSSAPQFHTTIVYVFTCPDRACSALLLAQQTSHIPNSFFDFITFWLFSWFDYIHLPHHQPLAIYIYIIAVLIVDLYTHQFSFSVVNSCWNEGGGWKGTQFHIRLNIRTTTTSI